MGESPPRQRRPTFVVLACVFAVGGGALAVGIWARPLNRDLVPMAVALLGLAAICFAIYWGPVRMLKQSDAPAIAPPDRAFKVTLLARGGWLSRYLAPDTEAHLVIADDSLHLGWKRAHNELNLAFWTLMLSSHLPWFQARWMFWPRMAGMVALVVLQFWFLGREIDVRYPWSRVHSVSVGDTRFLIRVDDDEFPDGFLVQVPIQMRKPIAALFATRASFDDEEANLAKSIRESRAQRE